MPCEEFEPTLSLGQIASLACILEVTAAKPGNVHRAADFDDVCLNDFLASAIAIGLAIDGYPQYSVGEVILQASRATRLVTDTNTNLGLILLIAPLAKAWVNMGGHGKLTSVELDSVLKDLDRKDSASIYEAIRIAQPSAMGTVDEYDCNPNNPTDSHPEHILDAMRLASSWDTIARQYCDNFDLILNKAVPFLAAELKTGIRVADATVVTHIFLMSEVPDTLIARKCGRNVSEAASIRAAKVLDFYQRKEMTDYYRELSDFDFWLRADGRRRNPGTTADLIGATLFVGLLEGWIKPPFR
ncbi:MAG TPA: triphosphoribosyl-dephospho-CoA synthase [Pirellulaceae bacterium]|nr:triphosphoribosyl-dephospho-CoA synthase [Pirellulaceae bacterium]HMO93867.1 triphosphoribosyl-dephospho-CoA synthase [Pirellulaceae bacterium]HMP71127.1 triphosphoribosyl-dephospho-CoA synthase [Pirellulaceae bacterium]